MHRFLTCLLVAIPISSLSADGTWEINQACATGGGCFAGDADGFPVAITKAGSYRLTSNLDLSAFSDTNAVEINADMVTLDLGGFVVTGDIVCTGTGATLDCPTGNGSGVVVGNSFNGVTIFNGSVRNMSRFGIASLGVAARIMGVNVRHNASDGFDLGENTIVSNSIARENGGHGFDVAHNALVSNSISSGNKLNGFDLASRSSIRDSVASENGQRGYLLSPLARFGKGNESTGNGNSDQCGGAIARQYGGTT